MDKKKEGVISSVPEAIAEAAKINIAATKETATSAVTSFVDTVIGSEKPRRGKRRVPKKKSSSASSTTKRSASGRTAAKKPARRGRQAGRRSSSTKSRRGSKSRSR